MLTGGGCVADIAPPVGRLLSGGNHSSDGASRHRKTAMRRLDQLLRANAGRRRMSCGWPNSCEAAVVGGWTVNTFSDKNNKVS